MKAIERLIPALKSALPGVQVAQVQTSLPGDDAGLWLVRHPDSGVEVNIESHNGEFPFLIENSRDDTRVTATNADDTVAAVRSALGILHMAGKLRE